MCDINGNILLRPDYPYRGIRPIIEWQSIKFKEENKNSNIELNIVMNLPKNGVFLDVGGHIGDTSLPISFYAKNNGRSDIKTLIFEPNKKKCEFIKKVIEMNNLNAKVYNVCVGDKERKVIVDPNQHGKKIRDGRGSISYQEDEEGGIRMINLDMIKEEIGKVGYIHIDAEGWDDKVIIGGSELIKENTPIIMCECWKHIGNTETNIKKILKKLNKNYDIMGSLNINGKDVNARNRRVNDPIFHISR